MSKSRSKSNSPLADVKPKLEEDLKLEDSLFPLTDTKSSKPEPSPPPKREPSESVVNVKPKPTGPQLIGELPRAEAAALATFEEIPDNHYQYGTLGRSREEGESMTCDCQYEHGVDDPSDACGHGSDCINRLTQVECLADDCRCHIHCQNQRFQRKEYGVIEIVQTEKKGFGLRAGADLLKDSFIYEYVGDVVSHPSFMKRMRQYGEEGVKHFYFMMLQKDEYIDATKRGGIGRFANHSCNPNCYVAKWTVGKHVRMGIFSNRHIRKDEELTFNYNVDRYGHEPQACYCGEHNCVGFLGGKTQTDIAGMDDLYLDALGISDEVEMLGLKGSKKRKGKKLDEDYMPELKPLLEKDIPKVVQAIRQTQSKKVLFKLLTRIKITEDQAALRQIMRLRGFSLMHNILEDHVKDIDITITALEAMIRWPLIQRNKVDDSKITIPVQACLESDNESMKGFAQKLLDYWDTLEVAYRIPKRIKADGEEEQTLHQIAMMESLEGEIRPLKKLKWEDSPVPFRLTPKGFRSKVTISNQVVAPRYTPVLLPQYTGSKKEEIAAVIAAAKAAAEAEAAKVPPQLPPPEKKKEKKERPPKKIQTAEEKEANKEKRLLKLVGAVVVKCMSKYSKKLDHDQFKKYAKELTHVIAEKEKKSSSYKDGKLDALSDEKTSKIKKFAKEYIVKVLRRLEKSKRKASSSDGPAASSFANADEHEQEEGGDVPMMMSVEEAMDLGDGSESEADDVVRADDAEMQDMEDMQHSSDDVDPSPKEGVSEHPPQSVTPITPPEPIFDPRMRHCVEEPGGSSKYRWDSST
ncbi:hypothetical protein K503DRAFT_719344 [Rhizopogon vinicolor AM-OR11-026]|uniref:Histone-lysine N-methyltransferase, H3 lysine-36 specific n=1 Tax=Rhizopogon vinicolor AM-OR11-026 TaxID=1314800 RepID=A0A1B7MYQ1_9AGAM|nr:hypothetical protein K503DRAFT_719344 [Rhizopogon vinicolor AM-OR11-026]